MPRWSSRSERFAGDLASARSAAAAAPSFAPASPASRAAAETLLLVAYVNGANAGCDSRGGVVVTALPPITWQADSGGTIGDVRFTAAPTASGWDVNLLAC